MAAYKQTRIHWEFGFGKVTDVLIFADSYNGVLDIDNAVEVNVFDIDDTEETINAGAEVFKESEIRFKLLGTLAKAPEDFDAINFVLSATDAATPVFCARIINPSTPLQPADVDFRGRVRTDFSGESKKWKRTGEYGTVVEYWRDYNGSATVFDLKELLSKKVKDVVPSIDAAWIQDNVTDHLAWFSHDTRQARFADMVALSSVIQKLLDVAITVPGTTVTYIGGVTDLTGWVARYHVQHIDGKHIRYPQAPGTGHPNVPRPFSIHVTDHTDQFQIKTYGTDLYSPYVNWRLVKPEKGGEKFSWEDWTLAQLILYIAYTFGLFVEFRYVDNFNVQIIYTNRQTVGSNRTYFSDPVKDKVDMKATPPKDNQTTNAIQGACNQYVKEGWRYYHYVEEGWFEQKYSPSKPEESGEFLPVTCSPSWVFLENRGGDDGYSFKKENRSALMPVNAIWYEQGSRSSKGSVSYRLGGWPEYNMSETQTGLFFKVLGRPDSDGYEYGVEGQQILAPLAKFSVLLNGQYLFFDSFADFVNFLNERGELFYEREQQLTIPGLCQFRNSEGGPNSWQACRVGNVIELNAIDLIITKVRRKKFETELTIHRASEYADFGNPFGGLLPNAEEADASAPAPVPPPEAVAGAKVVQETETAGEELASFLIVKRGADGFVYKASATKADQNDLLGMTLDGYTVEEELEPDVPDIRVVRSGPVYVGNVGVAMGLQAGDKLYLRTSATGVNWSNKRLTGKTSTEDLYCSFGRAINSSYIYVDNFDCWHFI